MYNNTKLRILERIHLDPGIHKRKLAKELKLGMPSIEYGINKLKDIILIKKSGNQLKLYLDYSKEKLTPELTYVEYNRFNKFSVKIKTAVINLLDDLKEKPLLVIFFGSYVKGDYTRDSDIDILLVFQKLNNTRFIENTVKKINMKMDVKLSLVYLDYNDFKSSFHNSSKKFFNDLKKERLILLGIEWWRLLKNEET
ncbi:hypothetical protein CL618_02085 [archaeon]|nr:hypothetical protein [archaeon]|tara:strand:- start:791 stop:1381 length:591 start_codon:yes stop_codon:yes gene_type:complete